MSATTQIGSPKPRKRCAVYCRVSSDERLDQEFNSIDAQKEAGQAYVVSQRSEGWIPVVDDYDDPGFSGGNTERPGLKRLMADIERGLVDIVVVYKIDRLTRSLADFSKMVEVFERQGVSFVSVTQQFNTTTSMGRLMLNVLLSFAQFEREVTGERIRDKIAASKRKGLWMGGVPPLGYDVANRLLVVNEPEAQLVRRIFGEMLTIGSPTRIAQGLASEGITTKAWTTQDGQVRSGTQMDRKYLYKLLRNRIYLGELSHKGSWFPGAHAPIIDHGLWGQVHEVLACDPHVRSADTQTRESTDALLRGLLFGPSGDPMYPTYASKNKRKYRYYVSKAEMRFGASEKTHARIPAAEVEAATVNQVKTVLSSPEAITAVCKSLEIQGVQINEDEIVMALHQLGEAWEQLYPAERIRIVKLMIERVDLVTGGLKVKWHALGWKELIKEFAAKSIGAELVEMEAA
ncbi:recombinase family protein [Rhodoferax antarcticus]|uniref:Resolvase, N terminal domain protein n=1 Tax=Rhodoferax antarcticus ANT.BR TaxID=1111071 RepID=A0A1Q8YBF6_9BURK|nr:recombinase family protein [Rhodoferax antarcticus]APW46820.1 recombinase [Rhodoferax antarcticus]OLP05322.1 resolvase, N terminal domain protein [Rhodoferax antarcticus ANT.BR]